MSCSRKSTSRPSRWNIATSWSAGVGLSGAGAGAFFEDGGASFGSLAGAGGSAAGSFTPQARAANEASKSTRKKQAQANQRRVANGRVASDTARLYREPVGVVTAATAHRSSQRQSTVLRLQNRRK